MNVRTVIRKKTFVAITDSGSPVCIKNEKESSEILSTWPFRVPRAHAYKNARASLLERVSF